MNVPHIKYIEALVCSRFSKQSVYDRLSDQEFFISFDGVEKIFHVLSNMNPDYLVHGNPDTEWLMEMGVDKMVSYLTKLDMPNGTSGIEGAFRILEDPLMYRLITSLALAKITDEDIELIVNGKYNISYTHEDIKEFLHYFFNVKDWSLSDKVAYIEYVEQQELKKFYKIALKGDKDYLVWKLGAAPNKTFDSMLRDIMTDSYYNFKESIKYDSDTAQKWGSLALKTVEKIEKLDKDTKDKRDVFEEIKFKLNQTEQKTSGDKIKHISEVSEND